MAVRFERRMAERFGQGRIWLVGDAGHLTGPIGGQSMNVGLREADQLAKTISGILHDEAPLDGLQNYATGRREEWRGLLGVDGELKVGDHADPWVRDYVGRLLPCIPGSEETLSRLVAQIGIEWTHEVH